MRLRSADPAAGTGVGFALHRRVTVSRLTAMSVLGAGGAQREGGEDEGDQADHEQRGQDEGTGWARSVVGHGGLATANAPLLPGPPGLAEAR